jgi:hypothetical protein
MIAVLGPRGDDAAGMIEAEEHAFVQELVAHAAIEWFE